MPSTLTISLPDFASDRWISIPREHRNEIRALLDHFAAAPTRRVTEWLKRTAPDFGLTYPTMRRKYYDLRNSGGDWTTLIDERKLPREHRCATRSPRFIAYLLELVGTYKRNNAAAFRELRRRWRVRDQIIPGYEDWQGWPRIPEGWTDRNLQRIVAREMPKAVRQSIRVGTSSKTNPFLPTTLGTRVGLWPGAVIQLDDQWHDNWVTIGSGKSLQLCRVLELGALDLFSAHRFHWGAKPRRRRDDGTMENIAGRDARFFLAGLAHQFGYAPQGTMLMVEHETMAIAEDLERVLYDATRGMLRVDRQPIEGKQAALSGYWSGSEGGNFRAKACIESTHNLIRNDLAALPMQTGSYSSGIQGPVTTDRQVAYITRILREVARRAPHRLDLLQLPTIDFHTQFYPFLVDYYQFGLAMRTDHDLEGWATLGHRVLEYTTAPGSDHFISEEAFLALGEATRAIITEESRREPAKWTRRRNLSPLEVWNRRPQFHPLGAPVICEMLTRDLAREVTAARGYLTFQDDEFAPDPLVYESRYISGPRAGREIGHGEKVLMFANPFDDATAIAVDAKERFLGELPLYKRVMPVAPDAFGSTAPFDQRPDIRNPDLTKAAGRKHQRIADLLAGTRHQHAETVQQARDLREHNRQIADPRHPITPEEVAEHRAEQRQHRRTEADRDLAEEALAATPRTWDDAPDLTDLDF